MTMPTLTELYAHALREIREIAAADQPDDNRLLTILQIAADALASGDGEA